MSKIAFEKWYKDYFGEDFEWEYTPYYQEYFLDCWGEAQKQVIPEGYVLVSSKDLHEIYDQLNNWNTDYYLVFSLLNKMIETQE